MLFRCIIRHPVFSRSAFGLCERNFCSSTEKKVLDLRFKNPCVELQQYVHVPIFREHEILFNPTIDDMREGSKFFSPSVLNEIKFLKSAPSPEHFPEHDIPEVAFIGRSNVGKSSLLQAFFSEIPHLVRTSKKPGQTKMLNFFQVGSKFCLVDMPGYGHKQPENYVESVESYLKTRRNLQRTFLLIDGKTGFTSWDEVALDMLEEFGIPYAFILTKIDKAITSRRLKTLLELQQVRDRYTSARCFPQLFMISSETHEGLAYLQTFIAHVTGNLLLQDSVPLSRAEKLTLEINKA